MREIERNTETFSKICRENERERETERGKDRQRIFI